MCSVVEFRGTKIQTRHVGRIGLFFFFLFFFQNPWKLTRMTSGRIGSQQGEANTCYIILGLPRLFDIFHMYILMQTVRSTEYLFYIFSKYPLQILGACSNVRESSACRHNKTKSQDQSENSNEKKRR